MDKDVARVDGAANGDWKHRRSIARWVADALRADALERADGELLGSEEDLIKRYNVSRPTLRQAAALLTQENLIVVKRGVGGGYFARRPDSKAVAHVAAVYLRSRKTRVEEIIRAVAPVRIEMAKLASQNAGDEQKALLRRFLDEERTRDREGFSYGDFLRSEREFGRILSEMSGNHVIALFLEILYDCCAMLSPDEDIYRNRPERVRTYREKRNRLAEALLDGDEEVTIVAARRCALDSADLMMSELERQPPGQRLLSIPGVD
jgi:DNA-binding FadR family transcriptional regulator